MVFRGRPRKRKDLKQTYSFTLSPMVDRKLGKFASHIGITKSEAMEIIMRSFLSLGKKEQAQFSGLKRVRSDKKRDT